MKNIYLFQPQYPVKVADEYNHWLPYSVGCLWSYVSSFDDIKSDFRLADIIYLREPHQQILDRLIQPDICCFSTYVWNVNYNLALARKIKARFPDCFIVFGGPETGAGMSSHDFIDCVVTGEGEQSFLDILRKHKHGHPIERTYRSARVKELDIPSPYGLGIFNDIIEKNPNTKWATTLETNRGCPYGCTFCDWGTVTLSKIYQFPLSRVFDDIKWISENNVAYLFVADANFGILKDRDIKIADYMRSTFDGCRLERINLTFAKSNSSSNEVIEISKLLGNLNRSTTVSVQSLDETTLKAIKRKNMSSDKIAEMLSMSNDLGLPTYTEFILGLPGETKESFKQGLCDVIELGQHNSIDVTFAQLFVNSEMSSESYRIQHGISSIKVHNFMTFEDGQSDEYAESIEIVNSTKYMSTEDMIESFMFAWTISNSHMNGHTQLAAKFARNFHGIAYRKFYDTLIKCLLDHSVFSEYSDIMITNIRSYLTKGHFISQGFYGNSGVSMGQQFFNENRSVIYEAAAQALRKLDCHDDSIIALQKEIVYDPDKLYPIQIESNFDVDTWKKIQTKYQITSKINNDDKFDYYALRRSGNLRNILVKKDA